MVSTGMGDHVLVQFPVWDIFNGRRNEYQPKGSDALQLDSKGGYGSYVGGR